MGLINAEAVTVALSADGTANGVATFTSVAGLVLGARCHLRNNTGASLSVQIIAINTTANTVTLRQCEDFDGTIRPVSYTATDISAFTTLTASSLGQYKQVVINDYAPMVTTVAGPTTIP